MSVRSYHPVFSITNLLKRVLLTDVHFDNDGLRVLVASCGDGTGDANGACEIRFATNPFLWRVIDEGDYLSSVGRIPHWFCTVENSELLDWFHKESLGVREGQGIVHYAIYTETLCVDVLHCEPPSVRRTCLS